MTDSWPIVTADDMHAEFTMTGNGDAVLQDKLDAIRDAAVNLGRLITTVSPPGSGEQFLAIATLRETVTRAQEAASLPEETP